MNTESKLQSLENRIEQLQRQLDARRVRYPRIVAGTLLCALTLLFVGARPAPQAAGIASERFVLQDRDGKIHGFFGVVDGSAQFSMNGKNGKHGITIRSKSDGGTSILMGPTDGGNIDMTISNDGTSMIFLSSSKGDRINIVQHNAGDAHLSFSSKDDKRSKFEILTTVAGERLLFLENAITRLGMTNSARGEAYFTMKKGDTTARAGTLPGQGFSVGAFTTEGASTQLQLPTPTKPIK